VSQKWSFEIEPLGRDSRGILKIPLGSPCRVKWYIGHFTLE